MIKTVKDQTEWDTAVKGQGGHPLQLWAWGELKTAHGAWKAERLLVERRDKIIGGAQVLSRKLPGPLKRMLYVPRGPFCSEDDRELVLSELALWAKGQGASEVKIEPNWDEMANWPNGWRKSRNRILVPKTAIIDLGKSEDEMLASMAKKTRQYIRKSTTDDVAVRPATSTDDITKCLGIYRETATRADFALHDSSYYYDLFKLAGDSNKIYIAESAGQTVSFLWNLRTPSLEFELYGGVNDEGQRLRSNYALKWYAIAEAKAAGVETYDMNGLLNDGISNFKRGFSDQEANLVGAWDLPLSPLYYVWETTMPVAKAIVQNLNKIRGRR